jgi:hypothetical protein
LKTGMTGSTSSLSHDQMSEGRYLIRVRGRGWAKIRAGLGQE